MSFTVTQRDGCTLITGSVPVSQLTALISAAGKGAVLSDNLARLAGVQLAWGQPADVDALEDKLRAEKLAGLIAEEGRSSKGGLSLAARRWLAVGEQGLSSCSIFWKLTGVRPDYLRQEREFCHPRDSGDLRRCLLLLDQVPELQGRIGEMAGCSPEWTALAAHWNDLCATMEAEAPDWKQPGPGGGAAETYRKMQEILRQARH